MRLVLAEWVDSHAASSWQHFAGQAHDQMVCRSVGWILHEDENVVVLVPHTAYLTSDPVSSRQGCGKMTIPTKAVVRTVDLVEQAAKSRRRRA